MHDQCRAAAASNVGGSRSFPDDRRALAHVSDALLGCLLSWRFWLCRKLKHRSLLTLDEFSQQDGLPIGKLECVMMHPRHVLVDLPKDRRPGFYCFHSPAKEVEGGRAAFYLLGKSKLCSRKNAHRRCTVIR